MIRTIIGVIILIGAVLWLPIWIQLALFAVAVVLLQYRYAVLIPAIMGDALYAPTPHFFNLANHWLTLIVLAMLAVYWYALKKLRVQHAYGLEA
jgi:hypothetical protein